MSIISTEKKMGRPTVRQAWMTISRVSPVTLLVAKLFFETMGGVFGHDNGLVHQDADGDGDAGQRHDVGLDVDDPQLHGNSHRSRKENRTDKRQRHADDEGTAKMLENQEHRHGSDQDFFPHGPR